MKRPALTATVVP
ncbi:hypothetical protein S40285_07965, partial [Stachybotrys chlorohalonatus IBT 40285]